jgi:formylglycine-generating enzyme required for sulfatase activity
MNTTFAQQFHTRSVVMPADLVGGSAADTHPGIARVMTQPARPAGAWRTAALVAVVAAALTGCSAGSSRTSAQGEESVPDPTRLNVTLVHLPAGQVSYYPPGDFTRQGQPANPGRVTARFEQGLAIMKHQVSQADYTLCVADGACKPLARNHRSNALPDHPVVGVSWQDANSFAVWLSAKTGQAYRLPTYQEWVFAAGSAYKEDVLLDAIDPDNPATYWLAEYELESQRKSAVDATVQPFGSFGVNEAGLQDMVGNVWDWTDTCHVRVYLDANGRAVNGDGSNCGIRVVAGPHRSYITDFIRDPKGGACSVGIPPSNLGFRLVRDDTASGVAAQAISSPRADGKAVNTPDGVPGGGMNRLRSLLGLG